MDAHSILGMMHAEEALLVSIVRSLPADIKRTIANDFHEQVELADGTHALITVHPSFLLRVFPEDREREYNAFICDLRIVNRYLEKERRAA